MNITTAKPRNFILLLQNMQTNFYLAPQNKNVMISVPDVKALIYATSMSKNDIKCWYTHIS